MNVQRMMTKQELRASERKAEKESNKRTIKHSTYPIIPVLEECLPLLYLDLEMFINLPVNHRQTASVL